MAGAPKGNTNAVKRPWGEAIRQALDQRHPEGRMAAMVEIANKLLDAGAAGDVSAIKELGDRLDGKPHQSIDASVEASVTVEVVRFGSNPPPE